MKKLTILIATLLIAVLALAACSQATPTTAPVTSAPPTQAPATSAPATSAPATSAPATSAPATSAPTPTATSAVQRGGTLRIADPVFPSNLGWPADPAWGRGGHAPALFFDTLLFGDSNGNIGPNLCSAFTVAPDKSSITLTLRKGVKFHDGSDWNATVAKWNLDILTAAKLGDYKEFKSVDIVDDYTIKINIGTYNNTLLTTLAATYVVSKAAFDKNGADWMKLNPVGTGPFICTKFEPSVSAKGTRNPNYWQQGKPYLDAVEFYAVNDPMTRSASLQAGEVDVIGGDLSKVEYDLVQKGFNIVNGYISVYTLIPDSKNANSPFANQKVREAMDYAIDRDGLVKALSYGFWSPTYQFALPGTSAFNSALVRPYDLSKAKQMLADAGFPNGFKASFWVNSVVSNRDAATAIQSSLGKAGINLDMQWVDGATANNFYANGWTNGLQGAASSIGANVNASFTALTKDNPTWYCSMDKTDAFYALYQASLTSPQYDVALVQKCVKYFFDNTTFNCIYAVSRGCVMPPWVKDTGFYTRQRFWYWNPADTWLSKH
jgi:peptide/nickel transport system substrate-binding protein